MNPAEAHFAAALAELRRAEGLWRGHLTAPKKALLEQRIASARRSLARCAIALEPMASEPEPIPARAEASGDNVVPLRAGA